MNKREEHRNKIIEKLKNLKSVYGEAARKQMESEDDKEGLIRICYEDAQTPSFQIHLGKELFSDIVTYQVKYNNAPEIEFAIQ